MAKSKLVQANEKIAEGVVGGYKKIENGVVGGFMKMEEGVVNGFNKITDKFVDEFLTKDGESVEDAKKRLAQEQEAREHSPKVKKQSTPSRNMEDAIRDRLENGFKTWNGGYGGWLQWCDTLYEPDAHYNVYGHRMPLQQYKDMMGQLFQHYTMELGAFDNMIIRDDWAAIRYTVKVKNLDSGEEILQNTMEFVHFKDNPDPIGVRFA